MIISVAAVVNTQKLKVLECRNNRLTSLLVSNSRLVTIGCEDNQLAKLDLSKNTSLNCTVTIID